MSLDTLNDKQREAVTSTATNTIVLAGPGSGKTRVLTHRIAHLINTGVHPASILAVTFTNKAAGEMKQRLATMLGATGKGINARTFHSFGVRVLRHKMPTLAPLLTRTGTLSTTLDNNGTLPLLSGRLNQNFSIYDTGDKKALLTTIIKDLNLDSKTFPPAQAAKTISHWKNEGFLPTDKALLQSNDEDNQTRIWRNVYVVYQNRLLANNACDFDDLILYPMLLWDWDTPSLRQYQDRFRYVLVDEFQDTNGVQYRIAEMLTNHSNGHLFVVGDEDQSVYAFRGADFTNVKRLMTIRPEHRLVLLEQNYRSNGSIVRAANALIGNNTQRVAKKLWTKLTGGTDAIKVIKSGSGTSEAADIAEYIRDTLDAGIAATEIAIVYRTNSQTRELESALVAANIPYRLLRGLSFYERREIRDAVAYLRFLYNGDVLSFKRIANVPKRGIGTKTIAAVEAAVNGGNIRDWLIGYHQNATLLNESTAPARWKRYAQSQGLALAGGAALRVRQFAATIAYLQSIPAPGAKEYLEAVIAILKPHLSIFDNPDEREDNLMELLSVAERVTGQGMEALAQFLEDAALVTDTEGDGGGVDEGERITLSTLHGAKGLEWDVVVLAGAEHGFCPHSRAINIDDIEEERRLFYVGVTRAKSQLLITHAGTRIVWGEWKFRDVSPFIGEMGL